MGFIIDFIIKVAGLRKFFVVTLIALQVAFFASYLAFVISLAVAIGKAYLAFSEIFDTLTQSSLGGFMGDNDINSIAWSVLNSIGIIDVFITFLPIVFSTVVFYLSIYLTGIVLTFQKNVYRALVDSGVIFLG
jgi:hypothetical protein